MAEQDDVMRIAIWIAVLTLTANLQLPGYRLAIPGNEPAMVFACDSVDDPQQLLDCSFLAKELLRLHILHAMTNSEV